ncbi:DUF1640 domain-containing protein [Xylella taiwanensis]|uniref:DUF1640 domain-containing protein n=2 Tax=Xylella taiwanensis TaxID=1444770 RepID=A0ABS8TW34_9GAMM|nr:DUF1640 domain-containing protein [Xylella taiwanensis]AXI83401.1 hypothetical protein AB672_05330 [Xylella taiwanensis]MCD8456471.1 DUF1640 domain-containing protein [Xylella taiwanensis]MCD8458878.1 DUF1640 domain-containing protein [Xylella taiwanensis]MCD8461015.1 DUF1640 domain-containing protein [Xylella taiwanensis]MCD8462924.1 DUF1640 domain-containing protein [Xylella taiwanensis]
MTSAAFDTLKYANQLKNAGLPSAHAEAEAEALAGVVERNRQDIADSESRTAKALERLEVNMEKGFEKMDQRFEKMDQRFSHLETRLAKTEGDTRLHSWMLGAIVTGIVTLIAKAFF